MSGLSDKDRLALDTIEAMPKLAQLGAVIAKGVENALAPRGDAQRVFSCLHILDSMALPVPNMMGINHEERRALICPMHPEKLLCNDPKCLGWHYRQHHPDEALHARCFVCEAPMLDPITGELHDFTGITGRVTLRAPVKFYDDRRSQDQWFTYSGVLGVLPVAYLCARHGRCVDLPLQMEWPSERSLTA